MRRCLQTYKTTEHEIINLKARIKQMKKDKIGIIGLGYVGLPLACLFAKKYEVVGYDLNTGRVDEINRGADSAGMMTQEGLEEAFRNGLRCTDDAGMLKPCDVYIIAVPTPVNGRHIPDTACLESASRTVGKVISRGDTVIYESTVYPGLTEELCLPIIERESGLKLNTDFFAGYSPERINPGDTEHTVENICKITSGSTPEAADRIDALYASVLKGGTYKASSIKVAEAAKVMENTQRDINIAFMNEMAIILNRIGIDTHEVIEAASTKWNFLSFEPGLVGGHCIGVDPYYLIQRAEDYDFMPRMMIEARTINEYMGRYVAEQVMLLLNRNGKCACGANILVMGFTFKENCPDVRNTKVVNVFDTLCRYTDKVTVLDPWADRDEVKQIYGIDIVSDVSDIGDNRYDAIVFCVKHDCFETIDIESLEAPGCVVYDLKGGVKNRRTVTFRL